MEAALVMREIEAEASRLTLLDPIEPSITAFHVDSKFRRFLAKRMRGEAAAYLFCCRMEGSRANLKMPISMFCVPDLLLGFYMPVPVTGVTPCDISANLGLGSVVQPITLHPGKFVPALKAPDGSTIPYPLNATWNSGTILVRDEADAKNEVWAVFALCSHVAEIRDTYWDLPGTGMFVRHGNTTTSRMFLRPGQEMPTISTEVLMNFRQRHLIAIDNTRIFEEELIQKAWHPSRFIDWCLDAEEKQDIRLSQ